MRSILSPSHLLFTTMACTLMAPPGSMVSKPYRNSKHHRPCHASQRLLMFSSSGFRPVSRSTTLFQSIPLVSGIHAHASVCHQLSSPQLHGSITLNRVNMSTVFVLRLSFTLQRK